MLAEASLLRTLSNDISLVARESSQNFSFSGPKLNDQPLSSWPMDTVPQHLQGLESCLDDSESAAGMSGAEMSRSESVSSLPDSACGNDALRAAAAQPTASAGLSSLYSSLSVSGKTAPAMTTHGSGKKRAPKQHAAPRTSRKRPASPEAEPAPAPEDVSHDQTPGALPGQEANDDVHSAKRTRTLRNVPRKIFREEDDEDDEDEENSDDDDMLLTGGDRQHVVSAIKRQLQAKQADLSCVTKATKGVSAVERKKLRNRKASCVSRLKKKLAMYTMQSTAEALTRHVALLTARLEERASLLRYHGIAFDDTPLVLRQPAVALAEEEAPTPVASPARPRPAPPRAQSHSPAPPAARTLATAVRSTLAAPSATALLSQSPRPTPRPRGRPRKTAGLLEDVQRVAADPALLQRQPSVQGEECVCLCRTPPQGDMLTCPVCRGLFHAVCVGAPQPDTFVCVNCTQRRHH